MRKRINEMYEHEIETYQNELLKLNRELQIKDAKLEAIQKLLDSTPSDCTFGPWCKACVYVKTYHVTMHDPDRLERIYVCGKSEVCPNFIDKYEEKQNERN